MQNDHFKKTNNTERETQNNGYKENYNNYKRIVIVLIAMYLRNY